MQGRATCADLQYNVRRCENGNTLRLDPAKSRIPVCPSLHGFRLPYLLPSADIYPFRQGRLLQARRILARSDCLMWLKARRPRLLHAGNKIIGLLVASSILYEKQQTMQTTNGLYRLHD